jgi:gluconate 2-dehydrogenase gamma chain
LTECQLFKMKNFQRSKKELPESIKNLDKWKLSRNHFIKTLLAGGVFIQLPLSGRSAEINQTNGEILTAEQQKIVESVQEILFPSDENGPGASEVNASSYLKWVLSDKEMDQDEVNYIINGIGWVNETSEEVFSKQFSQLTQEEKDQLIGKISKESWGESWLSVILTFIFEALLCDPQYGGNPDGIGWHWLNHNPGQPRPVKDLLYPEILTTIDKP